jgi:two-component system CheB/CheR fusion protein
VVITFVDVTQITLAEERIRELSQSLRNRVESLETLLDLVPVGIMIDEDGGAETARDNRYGAELLGRDHGDDKLLSIPADLPLQRNGARIALEEQPLRTAVRSGRPTTGCEARIARVAGDGIEGLMAANPLFDEAGRVRGAIASMVDITFRKKAEARQEMLLHELQHRVKNILATVTALASRMVGASTSIEQFSSAFIERLQAMARTHVVLSRHNWEGADLLALIDTTLMPYANEKRSNISASGPAVVLRPNAAATMGMVLFELANNAAKYGALASDKRSVELRWHVEQAEQPMLVLSWREQGGAPVEPPEAEGFGTNFIRRSLNYEAEGSADISYDPSGVVCRLQLPLGPEGAGKGGL